MKVLVLLSLVAFCASVPTNFGRRVYFGQDGTVALMGAGDYEVDPIKYFVEPRKLVTGTNTPIGMANTIDIDETNNAKILDTFHNGFLGKWNVDTDVLGVDRLQALLHKIKEQRDFQQGLFGEQQFSTQKFWTPEHINTAITDDEILRKIYDSQMEETPLNYLNHFVVTTKVANGQNELMVPEGFFEAAVLEKLFTKQEILNEKLNEIVEIQKFHITDDLVVEQKLINHEVELLIAQLVRHQTLITVQIEKIIALRQAVPQTLAYEQKLVYQQVHKLIEKLVIQQNFVNKKIQQLLARGEIVHTLCFDQQKVLFQQVFSLIQQLFVQQTVLKQHIQVQIMHHQIEPEQLIVLQKITYQQVEKFIQVLTKQFLYQQMYFHQLIQFLVQQGHVIPEEVMTQYTIVYTELHTLIQNGDIIPEEWITQHEMVHQQIILWIQKAKSISEQHLTQWVPEQWNMNRKNVFLF